ncbi:uncharacterized protein G2W53_039120 [Senna tora]|uniref:Uncharacterized protein n=1 Tax=Senna tora TaxID=362788 RepID=A0A834W7N6_9FABA|nr:uncharacterized protein G2W53_039120 [Senna tora]
MAHGEPIHGPVDRLILTSLPGTVKEEQAPYYIKI